jgi:hypothetical protein
MALIDLPSFLEATLPPHLGFGGQYTCLHVTVK